MPAPEFFAALDANLGAFTIKSLEKAAGLGDGTLRSARTRGNTPSLDVTLAVSRTLGVDIAVLMGARTPVELRGGAGDPANQRVPFLQLVASPLNPRRTFDAAQLTELADSIAAQGLLQNLVVRPKHIEEVIEIAGAPWTRNITTTRYIVVAGERRFRALEILCRENRMPADLADGIPCRIVTATDAEHITLALLENLQRVDVNPMDEAEAMHRLHAIDPVVWSTKVIAEKLGVTQRHIQLRLALVEKLAPDTQEQLRDGTITLAHAKILATRSAEDQQGAITRGAGARPATSLLAGEFLVSHAIFDVAKSGLETVAERGVLMFIDYYAALELQQKAVEVRAAELRAGTSEFVSVLEWLPGNEYEQGGNGIVLIIEDDGAVITYTGLKKVVGAKHTIGADYNAWEKQHLAERRYTQKHNEAGQDFAARIGLSLEYDHARQLLIWDAICTHDNRILSEGGYTDDNSHLVAIAKRTMACEVKTPKAIEAAWAHFEHLDEQVLRNGIIATVAKRMKLPVEGKGVSPVLLQLAAEFAIAVPNILREGVAERKARIAGYVKTPAAQTDIEDAISEAA